MKTNWISEADAMRRAKIESFRHCESCHEDTDLGYGMVHVTFADEVAAEVCCALSEHLKQYHRDLLT